MNPFAARAIFNVPMGMIYRGVLPFVAVNFLALLVITYVPTIAMVLIGAAR
jgi:TRAP-type C4-dicarboxylate transport system permease large subunit